MTGMILFFKAFNKNCSKARKFGGVFFGGEGVNFWSTNFLQGLWKPYGFFLRGGAFIFLPI